MIKNKTDSLVHMVYAGMFAALTALLTTVMHIPVGNGYVHCGDAVIYLAATMLPMPYAVCASAIGGMLADVLSGYTAYALPTFLIKALVAWSFARVGGKELLSRRKIPAMIVSGLVSVLGYWIAAVVLYGGWIAQLPTIPANCVQAAASGLVYAAAALGLRRVDAKAK